MSGAGLPLTRGSSFASGSWLDALGRTRVIVGYLLLLSFLVVYGFHSARVALNTAVDELRTRQTTFARDVGTLRDSIARTQNDVVAVAAGLQHVNEVLESIGRKVRPREGAALRAYSPGGGSVPEGGEHPARARGAVGRARAPSACHELESSPLHARPPAVPQLDALEESRAVEHLGSRTLALEGRMESSENMVRHLAQVRTVGR